VATYEEIYAAIDRVISGSRQEIPLYVYQDEDSVFDQDELALTWTHGKNITLGAATCDYINAALGKPSINQLPTARQIILNYATLTGDGHGEHDARIYSSAHARAMLGSLVVSRFVEDRDLEEAILDWGGSRCGFVGITMGRRPNLARDRGKYDPQIDPGVIVCDRDWGVEWDGDRFAGAPAVLEAQRIQASAVFGTRSWKEYHERGSSVYYWTHLEFGGGQSYIRTALDLRPDLKTLLDKAGKNDPESLRTCWEMAKKRIPKTGHFATARWEGGVAYWMPETTGAVSSSPGGLCLILFDDSRGADPIIFVNGYPGYTHTEKMSQTVTFDGDTFTLTRENGRVLKRARPGGRLVAWFEYKDGKVLKEFISGTEVPAPEPPPIEETGTIETSRWFINSKARANAPKLANKGTWAGFQEAPKYPDLVVYRNGEGRVWGGQLFKLGWDEIPTLIREFQIDLATGQMTGYRDFYDAISRERGWRWLPRELEAHGASQGLTQRLLLDYHNFREPDPVTKGVTYFTGQRWVEMSIEARYTTRPELGGVRAIERKETGGETYLIGLLPDNSTIGIYGWEDPKNNRSEIAEAIVDFSGPAAYRCPIGDQEVWVWFGGDGGWEIAPPEPSYQVNWDALPKPPWEPKKEKPTWIGLFLAWLKKRMGL